MPKADFNEIFQHLRILLVPYAPQVVVAQDGPELYYLNTARIQPNKTPLFFSAVQVKKNYVSFHLFPLYMWPEMVERLTPELRKRMQGKACFNFTKVDEALFAELGALVKVGFDRYLEEGLLS